MGKIHIVSITMHLLWEANNFMECHAMAIKFFLSSNGENILWYFIIFLLCFQESKWQALLKKSFFLSCESDEIKIFSLLREKCFCLAFVSSKGFKNREKKKFRFEIFITRDGNLVIYFLKIKFMENFMKKYGRVRPG